MTSYMRGTFEQVERAGKPAIGRLDREAKRVERIVREIERCYAAAPRHLEMASMDPLDGVTVFVTVVRCGNFTAAAEQLGCAKSTVSDQVTRLEQRIGARLLRRSSRAVTLTEAGRAYLCQIDDLLDRVREAEKAARAEATEPRGVLRLSAPAPFAAMHIAPLLPEFMARHPDVRIDLHVTAEVVDLVADGFDMAIRLCPRNDPSMIVRRLGGSRVIAVAAPRLFAGQPLPSCPEDLTGLPVIVNAAYPDRSTWHLEGAAGARSVAVNPIVITNCPEVLHRLVLEGAGMGQFCECHVLDDLRAGRMVRLLPDWKVAEIPILAVYPDNRQIAAKVRTFVDFLAQRLTFGAPLEAGRVGRVPAEPRISGPA
jgi:DNA-binding transcriptional LysR family regulator